MGKEGSSSPDSEVCRRQTAPAGREIAFPTAGAHVSPTLGPSGSPLSEPCPGRSNKTPGLLRHRHSSCLCIPPFKGHSEINGKRFISSLGGVGPTPPAAPLLTGLSFLHEQAAFPEKQPVIFPGWGPSPWAGSGVAGPPQSLGACNSLCIHSFLDSFIQAAGSCFVHTANIYQASARHVLDTVNITRYQTDKSPN